MENLLQVFLSASNALYGQLNPSAASDSVMQTIVERYQKFPFWGYQEIPFEAARPTMLT